MTVLFAIWRFAKAIPWQVYIAIGLLLAVWAWGEHRYSQGVEAERDRWEARIEAAKDRARDADVKAADTRAEDEKENTDASNERKDAIRDAGRDGLNCARLRRAYPDSPLPTCD